MSYATYARKSEAEPASKPKASSKTASSALRIAGPDDALEREADRVADAVMAGGPSREWSFTRMSGEPPLRRKCACGASAGAGGECAECKKQEPLQRKSNSPGGEASSVEGEVPPIVHEVLRSPGEPLDAETRAFFEPRFGHDFSHVRVHTDAKAAESARAVHAKAYTVGRHVAFSSGSYSRGSAAGQQLLAHELTHVAQQSSVGSHVGVRHLGAVQDQYEQEAGAAAAQINTIEPSSVAHAKGFAISSAPLAIMRSPSECLDKCEEQFKRCLDTTRFPPECLARRGNCQANCPLQLLKGFAAKFPDAADLVLKSPAAMTLLAEAEAAGAKFGGYVEDSPGKDIARAHTIGSTVYVPKTQTDKVLAMRDFLFELNNAIRNPKFAELTKEAAKGTKGTVSAKDYAYKMVELEVEGMLRLGEVWFDTKKTIGKKAEWSKYDNEFFYSEYTEFKEKKKTKDDIVKDVLKRVYDTGTLKGKTIEQYYIDDYNTHSGGK